MTNMNDDQFTTNTNATVRLHIHMHILLSSVNHKNNNNNNNNNNKCLKPSIKFTINNTATCSTVAGLSETVETALSKLFLGVKAG